MTTKLENLKLAKNLLAVAEKLSVEAYYIPGQITSDDNLVITGLIDLYEGVDTALREHSGDSTMISRTIDVLLKKVKPAYDIVRDLQVS